jgi:endo-1,3(4)-beta-glucanase
VLNALRYRYYNDHHFHYGYLIYAAAILAKMEPSYYHEHKDAIDALQRDIGNYDSNDKHFPLARHKDFYDGHSWASGLFWQGNGKSQESSSESLNAYYGLFLLGESTNNTDLYHWGRLLYSLELRSSKKYWHMDTDNIYDAMFAANKMAGVVGSLDTTCSTWFGNNYEYVHGINILPITPVTAELLDYDYVAQEYPVISSRLFLNNLEQASASGIEEQWKSIIFADHAVVDKYAAKEELESITDYGIGNSRSNVLLWVATRPYYGPFVFEPTFPNYAELIKPECAANSGCDVLGIVDLCCPTSNGDYLGCCPQLASED